jgi:hypothetical protein
VLDHAAARGLRQGAHAPLRLSGVAERTFTCFGGACTVLAEDADAVLATRDEMLAWHEVFAVIDESGAAGLS